MVTACATNNHTATISVSDSSSFRKMMNSVHKISGQPANNITSPPAGTAAYVYHHLTRFANPSPTCSLTANQTTMTIAATTPASASPESEICHSINNHLCHPSSSVRHPKKKN